MRMWMWRGHPSCPLSSSTRRSNDQDAMTNLTEWFDIEGSIEYRLDLCNCRPSKLNPSFPVLNTGQIDQAERSFWRGNCSPSPSLTLTPRLRRSKRRGLTKKWILFILIRTAFITFTAIFPPSGSLLLPVYALAKDFSHGVLFRC